MGLIELRLYHAPDENDNISLALRFEEDGLSYFDREGNLVFKAAYSSINEIRLERYDFNLRIDIYAFEANIELIDLELLDDMFDRLSAFLEAHASDKCHFDDCY